MQYESISYHSRKINVLFNCHSRILGFPGLELEMTVYNLNNARSSLLNAPLFLLLYLFTFNF